MKTTYAKPHPVRLRSSLMLSLHPRDCAESRRVHPLWNVCANTILPGIVNRSFRTGKLAGAHPGGTLLGMRITAIESIGPRLALSFHAGGCQGKGPILIAARPVTEEEQDKWGVQIIPAASPPPPILRRVGRVDRVWPFVIDPSGLVLRNKCRPPPAGCDIPWGA
eukprot:gene2957-biopygen20121